METAECMGAVMDLAWAPVMDRLVALETEHCH